MTVPKYVTGSALGDIDMILHDISQYLGRALGDQMPIFEIPPPWVNPDDGLVKTQDPDELLRRAKMVKDYAIRCAGRTPLDWGGFETPDPDDDKE